MLVLQRREQKSVLINGDVKVTVLDIKGRGRKVVSIGIDAPKSMPIYRLELVDKEEIKNVSTIDTLLTHLASCQRVNSPEWMEGLVDLLNRAMNAKAETGMYVYDEDDEIIQRSGVT